MKKNTKRIVIALIVTVVAVGIAWGIKLYLREKDPSLLNIADKAIDGL